MNVPVEQSSVIPRISNEIWFSTLMVSLQNALKQNPDIDVIECVGPPGSGKSRFATYVSAEWQWLFLDCKELVYNDTAISLATDTLLTAVEEIGFKGVILDEANYVMDTKKLAYGLLPVGVKRLFISQHSLELEGRRIRVTFTDLASCPVISLET